MSDDVINNLIEQRHALIRKTSGSYVSQQEKELDLNELSKVSSRIKELTYARIKGQRVKLVKKLDKETSIKDVRKNYNEKYESLCDQTKDARDFTAQLVEQKKYLRELKNKFDVIARKNKAGKALTAADKKIIEAILAWG